MRYISLIRDPSTTAGNDGGRDLQVTELFNGPFRRILEVRLQNGAVLKRHHAAEPITVYCVSGTGVFKAGTDLDDEQRLEAGTLITLDAGIDHEVVAEPDLTIIVSRFKSN